MNKIYRKVWNKALGRIVVASELASSDGGGTTVGAVGTSRGTVHASLVAAVALALASMGAQAQDQNVDVGPTGSVTAGQTVLDNDGIRVGNAVAIGANAISAGNMVMNATSSQLTGLSNRTWNPAGSYTAGRAATEEQLKVVSDSANAGWTIAVGASQAKIGPGGTLRFEGDSNITLSQTGADNNGVVGVKLNPNIDLGAAGSLKTGATTVNNAGLTVGTATVRSNAVTVGNSVVNTGGLTIAGGPRFTANGIDAAGQRITNLGGGTVVNGGTEAVTGGQLWALQQQLYNTGQGTRYFRANSQTGDSLADGQESLAIGNGAVAEVTAASGIAMGNDATTASARSIAIGNKTVGGGEFVEDTIAIGTNATISGATSNRAVAVGADAAASAARATALGANATAAGANSIALGAATASGAGTLAVGNGAFANAADSIALGSGAGQDTLGTLANDRTSHIAIGTRAGRTVTGNQNTSLGYEAGNNVLGDQNIAIGSAAGSDVDGDYNVAIGFGANSAGGSINNATAVGREAQATTDASALGANATALGNGSVAVGIRSNAENQATALGRETFASANSIALGSGSRALATDYANAGYLTGSAVIAGGSVLSVGDTLGGYQRRIVNVADGAQNFDAANIGQLKKAQESVANFVGGGVTLTPQGGFTAFTLNTPTGAQTFSTLEAAMSALSTGATQTTGPNVVTYNGSGQIANVAAGTAATDAVNVEQLNQTVEDSRSQYISVKSTGGGNQGNNGAIGVDAIAVGKEATAAGDQSTAVGYDSHANEEGAIALGRNVDARALNSTVLGNSSYANDENGIAIGSEARSTGMSSITIGTNAQADRKAPGATVDNAIVMGTNAEVSADDGIAMGHDALTNDLRGIAQGFQAHSLAEDSIAQGSRSTANGVSSQASGTDATSNGVNSIATGTRAVAHASNGIAMGTDAVAGFVVVDPSDSPNNANAVAIGNQATGSQRNTTAVGNSAKATNFEATAVGNSAEATGQSASAIGNLSNASGNRALAAGDMAAASGTNSIAVGPDAEASGNQAIATGSAAKAAGAQAVATGAGAEASGPNSAAYGAASAARADRSTALGAQATAGAIGSLAVGQAALADAQDGVAIGRNSQAIGLQSTALGTLARSTVGNAVAIGFNAAATNAGAVALGAESTTAAVVPTQSSIIDGKTYTYAGANPNSTVSVGSATNKRTITNVAAGRVNDTSTDAINGSQLNRTNQSVEALAGDLDTVGTSVKTALGGSSSYDPITHQVTAGLAVGGTTYNNVQDALTRAADGINLTAQGTNLSNVGQNSTVGATMDLRSVNNNIGVSKSTNSNTVEFALAEDIDLGTNGSVKTGNTLVDNAGVAVVNGVETTRITAGNVAVGSGANTTNVGPTSVTVGGANPLRVDGSTGTVTGLSNKSFTPGSITSGRAATEDQLQLVSNVANAGWNVTDANGNTANIGPDGQVAFIGDDNLTVAQTGAQDAGVVGVALKKQIDLGTAGSVTTGNTQVNNNGVVVNDGVSSSSVGAGNIAVSDVNGTTAIGGNSITVGGTSPIVINGSNGTVNGLTNKSFDPTRFTSGQAASEDQLAVVSQTVSAGWNISAGGQNASKVSATSPTGSNVDLRSADRNVVVTKTTNSNDVEFALADDLAVAGSVTVGNTRIDTTGLTIVGGPSITTAGIDAGSSRITNVATGVDGTDAVNVDQLDDIIEARRTRYYSVNSAGGGNEANDGATGADAIASGRDAEANGDQAVAMGLGAQAAGNGSVALGAGARAQAVNSLAFGNGAVASHGNSIAMGAGSATTVGAQANYQGAYVGNSSSTGEMNLGGRQVTGVAAGSAATDAVNVSQLTAGVASAVSDSNQYTDTQISTVNTRIDGIDSRVTNVEGDIIDIRGDITDIRNDVVDIQGDITNLDGRVNTMERDLNNANMVAGNTAAKVTNMEYGADGMFQVSQDGDLNKPQVTGQNAVGGGKGTVASGNNSTALGNQAVASGANSTAIGQGAVASHDNSVALGQGSKTTVGAQTGYNAAYVGTSSSTGEVNIGGRTMTGVAAGIAGTDATNVNQLAAGVNQAITSANQYTDNRIGKVEDDLWQLDRGYRSATAAAMAMAGLPQAYMPGKSMLSMAFGGYQSEYGMALGLSGITDNGRWVYKAQASGNTMRDWGFSVGAGLQW